MVKGDLSDKDSLVAAASGVDAVFGVGTPYEKGTEVETTEGLNLVNAAAEAGVGYFLFSSVGSAHLGTGIPHFESKYVVEQRLRELDMPFTIIGPVFFMENWLSPWFLPPLQEGNVALALPAGRNMQQISVQDVGNFAALIFERKEAFIGKRIDIASDDLTGPELAEIIGRKARRKLGYFEIPLSALYEQNADWGKMFEWFDKVGYSVNLEALRRDYPEVGWTRFSDWVDKQDWSALDAPSQGAE
jgi:uncharacterized protein YbjT (DUF2867 family)